MFITTIKSDENNFMICSRKFKCNSLVFNYIVSFWINAIVQIYDLFLCFNQRGDISTLNGSSLKLVDKFTYLGNSVSSTEKGINTWLLKAWTANDSYRSYGSQTWPIKWNAVFFQAAVVSVQLYRCTTWTLTKCMEKKLDGNYTRILRAILNKSRG